MSGFRSYMLGSLLLCSPLLSHAQGGTEETRIEAQAESMAESDEGVADGADTENFVRAKGRGLHINLMDLDALVSELGLTRGEAVSLVNYRARNGAFIDPMELQAVPGWSLDLVRRILPLVRLDTLVRLAPEISERLREGGQQLLFRLGSVVERSRGYVKDGSGTKAFAGDPLRATVQYRLRYRSSLDLGIRMEKDAGERWLTTAHTPDHFSGHLVLRDLGLIHELLIGDYEVALAQGLVQWQGMAFRKGANTLDAMRSMPVFRAHGGADENRYHRGAAISLQRRSFSGHFFLALDRLDAHRNVDSAGLSYFTGFQTSGLHRTQSELRDRHALTDLAYGGRLAFSARGFWIGWNLAGHRFGGVFRNSGEPYALYGFTGSHALNSSIDHHIKAGFLHIYGEWAMDKARQLALTEGLLFSPGARLDLVMQTRLFSSRYRGIMESPYAEGSRANNERGLYIGMEWRPSSTWRVNAYVDRYRFSWLRFGVDAPSDGMDAMVRVGWRPEKTLVVYGQCSWESRPHDLPGTDPMMPGSVLEERFRARLHLEYALDRFISLRIRSEYNVYRASQHPSEQGFLSYLDLSWRGHQQRFRASSRVVFYHTDGYGSRIYAYEGRSPGMFAIPAHYGQGVQWSWQAVCKLSRHMDLALHIQQNIIQNADSQGTGYDEILHGRKTEWNIQFLSSF